MAVMDATRSGPARYGAAPVVVAGDPVVGDQADPSITERHESHLALPVELVTDLRQLDGVEAVAADRTVSLRLVEGGNAEQLVGRPWPVHAATPYELVEGRAPAGRNEIVVTAGAADLSGAGPGAVVELVTPVGASSYTVVGLAASSGGRLPEQPVFLHRDEAAELAPAIDAVTVWPAAAEPAVAALVASSYPGAVVLSDQQRADVDQDAAALAATGAVLLMSFMLATVAFVVMYSLATTFSMSVALRRRELGLFRATGATPRQVRRLVLREASLLTMAASAVGAVASLAVGPALGRWLASNQLVAPDLAVTARPEAIALAVVSVEVAALAGAWVAARRASRVRPVEALADAVVDSNVMSPVRWLVAVPSLGGAVALATIDASNDLEAQLALAMGQAILAITGLAMVSPLIVPRLVALVIWPLSLGGRATALLVGHHARAGVRRTTAMASPALVAVGLTLSLVAVVRTIEVSEQVARREAVAPGALVVTAGDAGLSAADVEALAAVPGTRVGAVLEAGGYLVDGGLRYIQLAGIDGAAADLAVRSQLVDGDLGQLRGSSVALGELVARSIDASVGDQVSIVLPDGTRRDLAVVAVVANGLDRDGLFVPRSLLVGHAGSKVATDVFVAADVQSSAEDLTATAAARGLVVSDETTQRRLDVTDSSHLNRLALIAILGAAIAYVSLAIASSAAVLSVSRAGELAAVRLAGATRREVVMLAGIETLLAVATGALLGVGAATVPIAGMARSLASLAGPTQVSVPWSLVTGLTLAGGAVAVVVSTAAAWWSQHRPPHELALSQP
jgi:putative ABC transport system permease protein